MAAESLKRTAVLNKQSLQPPLSCSPVETSLPFEVCDIVSRPVAYRLKSTVEDSTNEIDEKSLHSKQSIFDVIETHKPPDVPQHWFHKPGALGDPHWSYIRHPGRGLHNFSNTCFINAVLQALAYCPSFSQKCLQGSHQKNCIRRRRQEVCGYCHYEDSVKRLFAKGSSNQKSQETATMSSTFMQLIKKISLGRGDWYGQQNCAHEYLVQFLDFLSKYDLPPELEKDFAMGKIAAAELSTTFLQQTFSSIFQDSKRCQFCGKSTTGYELNTCLRISLKGSKSVESALQSAFMPEIMSGNNRPLCESCGVPRDKLATRKIYRPPNILIVLVEREKCKLKVGDKGKQNRYYFTGSKPRVVKNNAKLIIPALITLNPYLSADGRKYYGRSDSAEKPEYRFVASVNHHGDAYFGHFWSVVQGPDNCFYNYDDERVTLIPPSRLTEAMESAYLVFYQRTEPVDPALPSIRAGIPVAPYVSSYYRCKEIVQSRSVDDPWQLRFSLGIQLEKVQFKTVGEKSQTEKLETDTVSTAESLDSVDHSHSQSEAPGLSVSLKKTHVIESVKKEKRKASNDDTQWRVRKRSSRHLSDVASSISSHLVSAALGTSGPFRESCQHKSTIDRVTPLAIRQLSSADSQNAGNRMKRFYTKGFRHRRLLSKKIQKSVAYSKTISLQRLVNYTKKANRRDAVNGRSSPCSLHQSPQTVTSSPLLHATLQKTFERPSKSTLDSQHHSMDLAKSRVIAVDAEAESSSAKQHSKRVVEEPLKPQVLNEKAKSVASQYASKNVSRWDESSDDDKSLTQSSRCVFEAIQRQLGPKTSRRSRHDKEYDKGKTKKVISADDKRKAKRKFSRFNFASNADRMISRLKK